MDTVIACLVEAASVFEVDPSWSTSILSAGIEVKHTWEHNPRNHINITPMPPARFYSATCLVSWTAIETVGINPLISAMENLLKQRKNFKP